MKIAASPARIETAERRLFVQGYFVAMGAIDSYGLGTVLTVNCYYSSLHLGGQPFKVGQLFRLFNPDR